MSNISSSHHTVANDEYLSIALLFFIHGFFACLFINLVALLIGTLEIRPEYVFLVWMNEY